LHLAQEELHRTEESVQKIIENAAVQRERVEELQMEQSALFDQVHSTEDTLRDVQDERIALEKESLLNLNAIAADRFTNLYSGISGFASRIYQNAASMQEIQNVEATANLGAEVDHLAVDESMQQIATGDNTGFRLIRGHPALIRNGAGMPLLGTLGRSQ
jgi:lysyl-tRNA synthetase class II